MHNPTTRSSRRAWAAAATWILAAWAGCAGFARADGQLHTLWSVKGRTNTVYLLGSIHVLKPGDSQLPAEALRAYAAAKSLVMEIDLGAAGGAESLLAGSLDLATLPEGQTLAGALGADAYRTLAAHAKPLGLDLEMMSRFQPWFVAITLTQLELARLGFDANSGVDEQFAHLAAADHKPIIALETVDEQLGLFAHMSLDQQRRFLLYSLDDADHSAERIDAMVVAWRAGDTARLEALLADGLDRFPDLFRTLTTDRNRKWLPRVSGLLQEKQDYLVVVGAMHLIGKGGLVDLLTREGYTVVQQ